MITQKEIIRLALIYAIGDRESYLDSYSSDNSENGKKIREETKQEIANFKKLLKKKYNEITANEWIEKNAVSVNIHDLILNDTFGKKP